MRHRVGAGPVLGLVGWANPRSEPIHDLDMFRHHHQGRLHCPEETPPPTATLATVMSTRPIYDDAPPASGSRPMLCAPARTHTCEVPMRHRRAMAIAPPGACPICVHSPRTHDVHVAGPTAARRSSSQSSHAERSTLPSRVPLQPPFAALAAHAGQHVSRRQRVPRGQRHRAVDQWNGLGIQSEAKMLGSVRSF